MNKKIIKIVLSLVLFISFVFVINYATVKAEQLGSGDNCFSFDIGNLIVNQNFTTLLSKRKGKQFL